ncbi:uncharacterized protein MONOS_2664 [Monocercomonoides exilis]|uniref:uncharacterized protein n=1 Tax=Monocercomonoides exilis TaxID=2049356 RepID=UPI00355AC817|nr:hypothetical protein MONOS_2664 [Monocercomonoides exilis]|eukprot:MONOS_2664.1-p1 / transcript=MONOS_2664.1 / gene=MONOS_2664 / organism=Monocercomonoides_exilis_PA203 / gene_product=unspecified product / transcript_product=unspecified product / location=Mono_scaffold00056:46899-51041(+) / protein_length=1381 / sequence_SO=supercontig / SO=protein_coding / is_pseudo=false
MIFTGGPTSSVSSSSVRHISQFEQYQHPYDFFLNHAYNERQYQKLQKTRGRRLAAVAYPAVKRTSTRKRMETLDINQLIPSKPGDDRGGRMVMKQTCLDLAHALQTGRFQREELNHDLSMDRRRVSALLSIFRAIGLVREIPPISPLTIRRFSDVARYPLVPQQTESSFHYPPPFLSATPVSLSSVSAKSSPSSSAETPNSKSALSNSSSPWSSLPSSPTRGADMHTNRSKFSSSTGSKLPRCNGLRYVGWRYLQSFILEAPHAFISAIFELRYRLRHNLDEMERTTDEISNIMMSICMAVAVARWKAMKKMKCSSPTQSDDSKLSPRENTGDVSLSTAELLEKHKANLIGSINATFEAIDRMMDEMRGDDDEDDQNMESLRLPPKAYQQPAQQAIQFHHSPFSPFETSPQSQASYSGHSQHSRASSHSSSPLSSPSPSPSPSSALSPSSQTLRPSPTSSPSPSPSPSSSTSSSPSPSMQYLQHPQNQNSPSAIHTNSRSSDSFIHSPSALSPTASASQKAAVPHAALSSLLSQQQQQSKSPSSRLPSAKHPLKEAINPSSLILPIPPVTPLNALPFYLPPLSQFALPLPLSLLPFFLPLSHPSCVAVFSRTDSPFGALLFDAGTDSFQSEYLLFAERKLLRDRNRAYAAQAQQDTQHHSAFLSSPASSASPSPASQYYPPVPYANGRAYGIQSLTPLISPSSSPPPPPQIHSSFNSDELLLFRPSSLPLPLLSFPAVCTFPFPARCILHSLIKHPFKFSDYPHFDSLPYTPSYSASSALPRRETGLASSSTSGLSPLSSFSSEPFSFPFMSQQAGLSDSAVEQQQQQQQQKAARRKRRKANVEPSDSPYASYANPVLAPSAVSSELYSTEFPSYNDLAEQNSPYPPSAAMPLNSSFKVCSPPSLSEISDSLSSSSSSPSFSSSPVSSEHSPSNATILSSYHRQPYTTARSLPVFPEALHQTGITRQQTSSSQAHILSPSPSSSSSSYQRDLAQRNLSSLSNSSSSSSSSSPSSSFPSNSSLLLQYTDSYPLQTDQAPSPSISSSSAGISSSVYPSRFNQYTSQQLPYLSSTSSSSSSSSSSSPSSSTSASAYQVQFDDSLSAKHNVADSFYSSEGYDGNITSSGGPMPMMDMPGQFGYLSALPSPRAASGSSSASSLSSLSSSAGISDRSLMGPPSSFTSLHATWTQPPLSYPSPFSTGDSPFSSASFTSFVSSTSSPPFLSSADLWNGQNELPTPLQYSNSSSLLISEKQPLTSSTGSGAGSSIASFFSFSPGNFAFFSPRTPQSPMLRIAGSPQQASGASQQNRPLQRRMPSLSMSTTAAQLSRYADNSSLIDQPNPQQSPQVAASPSTETLDSFSSNSLPSRSLPPSRSLSSSPVA